jgi:two-component system chemotaxis response regulator CheB
MIRVLIAEDSSTVRELLEHVLGADPEIVVVGTAKDGVEAVAHTKRLRPDVIVMDINMPNMDGLEATKHIMIEAPTPIVIVSATVDVREASASVAALNAGALALLAKPPGVGAPAFEESVRQLVSKVKAMAGVKVVRHWRAESARIRPLPPAVVSPTSQIRVLAIGASIGGPATLAKILSFLPVDFPVPILVVQHIARGFIAGFASWLNTECPLKVRVAEAGEPLAPSTVFIAGDDLHMGVSRQCRIRLNNAEPIGGFRPSATYLFERVAEVFGSSAAAVILSGMGEDGVAGLRAIRDAGGYVIAQDEASSVVFGMPGAAISAGLANTVLPPPLIAKCLIRMVATEQLAEIKE